MTQQIGGQRKYSAWVLGPGITVFAIAAGLVYATQSIQLKVALLISTAFLLVGITLSGSARRWMRASGVVLAVISSIAIILAAFPPILLRVGIPLVDAVAGTVSPTGRVSCGNYASVTLCMDVRLKGEGAWSEAISVAPGRKLQARAIYTNITSDVQSDVMLRMQFDSGFLLASEVLILNANNPSGAVLKDGSANILNPGVNIGSYTPGSNAIVSIEIDSPTASEWTCGIHPMQIQATLTPRGATPTQVTLPVNVRAC